MILKLKRTPGIYLVGFMGSGKSTVGRALADELGWNFLDLDDEIERRARHHHRLHFRHSAASLSFAGSSRTRCTTACAPCNPAVRM